MAEICFSLVFGLIEKNVSDVPDNTAEHLWEEGGVEDELSPEEIQMVQ